MDEGVRELPEKPVDRGGEDALHGAVCGQRLQPDANGETVARGGEPATAPNGGVSRKGPAMPQSLENEAKGREYATNCTISTEKSRQTAPI